ncbi:ABC transporter substrate-binding protein [Humibacter sp.]|jgi:polar amino acid transport system substrate-binding protein|uniref:ABC transporter substrate-binding protein n=1 Tax=Humibacter sp. TaxID=1940291 RepID=UPI002B94B5FD|nr:ABC transporter substrate-binding protein [Humibacter sp.]HVX07810.1 ABC transporter substrate-binding protein [Humibacter sp.]
MRIRYALPVVAVATALLLTGCVDNSGGSGSGSTQGSGSGAANPYGVKKDDALAKTLPSKIAKAGEISVGMDATYAPNEYKDSSGKPIGWDVDLANAVGAKLGVKMNYTIAKFDNIIPSITGGRYDIGVSSFTDTTEREKQVDFVNYYNAGILWASQKGKTVDPDNACGLKVAVEAGTYEDTDEVPAKSKACTDAGKPAIQVLKFDGQDQATNALVLGQVDAMSADSPITEYAISKQSGKIQPAGKTFDIAPYGIAVDKGAPLTKVIQKTLQSLVDDGTYTTILKKWGVEDGAVTTVDVNAASKQ